jgi:TRAP-type C4-dicarboxylate transport system substrate-binding protein
MITRRRFNTALAAAPAVLAASGSVLAQSRVTLQVATWGSPTHVNIVEFLGPLEAFLKERTGGRISVRHFPSGQLAQDSDMPVAIPTGRVQIGWVTLALWSGLVPDVRIGDAPTGLTMEQFAKAIDGPDGIKAVFDREFRVKAATLFAVTDLGPVVIVSNKQIMTPADLKNVRIRVFSEGTATLFRALGAAPLQIPFADVYTSLQRGTIDAALMGFQGIASQRMYEIAKFALVPASFVGTGLQGYAGNLPWWMSLQEADRAIVSEGMAKAEAHCRKAIIDDRKHLETDYRGKGMTVVSLQSGTKEHKAWADATAPVLKQKEAGLSKEIMAPVLRVMSQ